MSAFINSGLAVDLILALVLVEAVGLGLYHRVTGRGLPLADLAMMLLPGALLIGALRLVLGGAAWYWTAALLAAAFAAHMADLRRRWASTQN